MTASDIYRVSIDRFNASQPNKELLDGIRAHNHRTLDDFGTITPLKGAVLLDIDASPHGYALEKALEHGVTLYVGVGLDISPRQCVLGDRGNIGLLLRSDASRLLFPEAMFDAVLSVSTFEHIVDVEGALSEIARVLKPGGRALLTFEPIWSCSSGHHLHHFGKCAALVPPWGHLTLTPEQTRELLAPRWSDDPIFSLEQAIRWVYFDTGINRLTIRDYREMFGRSPLRVEWMVDLRETECDRAVAEQVSRETGMSVSELTTKGLSVLLKRDG